MEVAQYKSFVSIVLSKLDVSKTTQNQEKSTETYERSQTLQADGVHVWVVPFDVAVRGVFDALVSRGSWGAHGIWQVVAVVASDFYRGFLHAVAVRVGVADNVGFSESYFWQSGASWKFFMLS